MKKLYTITIALITTYFSLNAQTNIYDTTLYEVGYYTEINNYPNTINPNQSFEDENWSFSINPSVSYFDYYENQYMYLYEDIIVSETYNVSVQYTISIEKEIPIMLSFGDIQVDFQLNVGDNYGSSTISLFYYDVNNHWVQSNLTTQIGVGWVGTITNATKLKIEISGQLPGTMPNGESYKLRQLRVLGNKSTLTNIQENIDNNFNVYSYNKNLVVKTTTLENYNISIYNISGQEVLVKNAQGNQDIPLNLATGVYIVNVSNSKESYNQKVVVQ